MKECHYPTLFGVILMKKGVNDKNIAILHKTIDSSMFDFDGLNDETEIFGKRYDISARMIRNIQLAAEEIVHRCITEFIEHNEGSGYPVELDISYLCSEGTAKMTVTYYGSRFDPFEYVDELSMMLVEKLSAEAAYSYDDKNRFVVSFN